ncbi:MAG TPA: sigma-70 family RNA polymerase sigma factor [Tepidisphaeraceae bacterium]|jgi:RNA polymerase sigma-70 factor (ECF subfamily)
MKLTRGNFEQLALEHVDAVYRVAISLCGNPTEAEDLAQETYLRAFQAADSFELRDYGIKPWLLRILNNIHFTRGRRESMQPRAIDDMHLHSIPDTEAATKGVGGEWEANEDLAQAMAQLPAELRATLTLWSVDELSYKEIADVMDVPIGTVMSRLHRGRERLRELLNPAPARE